MGNAASSPSSPQQPSSAASGASSSVQSPTLPNFDKLKFKTGNKNDVVPYPSIDIENTYEKLTRSREFKEYVYKNLDSDYLLKSILANASEDQAVLDGIHIFDTAFNADMRDSYQNQLDNYASIISAGIKVNLLDNLDLTEKELRLRLNYKHNPFLRSIQIKLAVLRCFEESIINERKIGGEQKCRREFAYNALNVTSFPQLQIIDCIKDSGLGLLRVFPLCIGALADKPDQLELLVSPVRALCAEVISIPDCQLFNTWSPKPKPPSKALAIKAGSAKASTGVAGDAVNGVASTAWANTRGRATWTIELDTAAGSGVTLTAIRICWAQTSSSSSSSSSSSTPSFAPKRLTVSIRQEGKATFTKMATIDPEAEYRRQQSWNQVYMISASKVSSIQIAVTKPSQSNLSACTKMFEFEALTDDLTAKSISTVELLKSIQSSLVHVLPFDFMQPLVLDTLISLVRISGSLSIALRLAGYFYDSRSEYQVKKFAPTGFLDLLRAIDDENTRIVDSVRSSYENMERLQKDVSFDESAKSSDALLSDGDMVLSGNHMIGSMLYGMLTCVMETGAWVWEISLTLADPDEESACLGVSSRLVRNSDYETTDDMWLFKCYNGYLYHGGRHTKRECLPLGPKDICRFTFDTLAQTLSLSINDLDQGVIFDNVPRGVSPVVSFYSSRNSAKLLSVRHREGTAKAIPLDLKKYSFGDKGLASISEKALMGPLSEGQGSNLMAAQHLLRSLARLSETRLYQLSSRPATEPKSKSVEFPFCVEVSVDVIGRLVDLLNRAAEVMPPDRSSVLDILQLIDSQFSILNTSNVDLADVGFAYCRSDNGTITFCEGPSLDTVKRALDALEGVRRSSDDAVSVASSRVFARGSALFLPNINDKVTMAVSLLTEARTGNLSEATLILLEMLVQTLSECDEVVKVVDLYRKQADLRGPIKRLLDCLITLLAEHTARTHASEGALLSSNVYDRIASNASFKKSMLTFLVRFQEQLIQECVLCSNAVKGYCDKALSRTLYECFVDYTGRVISAAGELIDGCNNSGQRNSVDGQGDLSLRESLVTCVLQPLIYSLCFFHNNLGIMRGLLPPIATFLKKLSLICMASEACVQAQKLIFASLRRGNPKPTRVGASGWRQIKVFFEDNQPSYSVSDGGLLYTAVHSGNTCALLNVCFSKNSRAAWEFLLETDSINDECSVFGIARMPKPASSFSRCYSSSPDLWMRRAYNGYMYGQGRSTGVNLEKIHPGDKIRMEFDGRLGTLTYSVNGGEPELGFGDIWEPVYPTCGSYRTGVQVRLLKVEVYSSSDDEEEDIGSRPPHIVNWVVDPGAVSTRDPSVLSATKSSPDKENSSPDSASPDGIKSNNWLTSRGDCGVQTGVHEWSFEVLERSKASFAFGAFVTAALPTATPASNPYTLDFLAGTCTAPTASPSPAKATKSMSSVDASLPPPPTTGYYCAAPASSDYAVNGGLGLGDALITSPAKSATVVKTYSYADNNAVAVSWNSDGSLWSSGVKVGDSYGTSLLPLEMFSAVSVRIDCDARTVRYLVNGQDAGLAFGPPGSGAAAPFPVIDGVIKCSGGERIMIYPAASVASTKQSIRIKVAGFNGSTVIPIELSLQKASASVFGRLAASLIAGPAPDKQELDLVPWLQSPLLIGGIEAPLTEADGDDASSAFQWADGSAVEQAAVQSSAADVGALPEVDIHHRESQDFLAHIAEMPDGSLEIAALPSAALLLLQWLESIEPDAAFMRSALEKLGTYKFPKCEMPFIACLLKHGGLVSEAQQAVISMRSGATGPAPSREMVTLWKRVKQMRLHLRRQRQAFKAMHGADTDSASNSARASPEKPSTSDIAQTSPVSPQQPDEPPVPAPIAPQVLAPTLDLISRVSRIDSALFLSTDNLVWQVHAPTTVSGYSTAQCQVLAVGVDYENEVIYIRFEAWRDEEYSEDEELLGDPNDSSLFLDDYEVSNPDGIFGDTDPSVECYGCLRFDMSACPRMGEHLSNVIVSFRFADDNYDPVQISLPAFSSAATSPPQAIDSAMESKTESGDDAGIADPTELPPSTFAEYCDLIESKTRFLLKLIPSENRLGGEGGKSRDLLLDLLDRHSKRTFGNPQFMKVAHIRSEDGQGRWGRVIDFLRVHSRMRRQMSTDSDGAPGTPGRSRVGAMISREPSNSLPLSPVRDEDLDMVEELEASANISPAEAALQACVLFVTSDTVSISLKSLQEVMVRRNERCSHRAFALDALEAALQVREISSDPLLLEELLLFVKDAMSSYALKSNAEAKHASSKQRVHYLANLEGCRAEKLCRVQEAFLNVYSNISALVAQYMECWEAQSTHQCVDRGGESQIISDGPESRGCPHVLLGPLRVMLSLWEMHFSGRDFHFLRRCGILPTLQKIITLPAYERLCRVWHSAAIDLATSHAIHAHKRGNTNGKWSLWSSAHVHSGLKSGALSCRAVLLHLYVIPDTTLTASERAHYGLNKSFADLASSLGVAEVSLLYNQLWALVQSKNSSIQLREEQRRVQEAEEASKRHGDHCEKMAAFGAFDSDHKAAEIHLSDYNLCASIGVGDSPGTSVCAYASVHFDCDDLAVTGNYFEVEISIAGRRDIGIGLADRAVFSTSENMPGWQAHSYGYHGDDGHKFGANPTPGEWPFFYMGDVIGCGIAADRRAIFYTKNGELIGDAFTSIEEKVLWPIVGFSNRHSVSEKVRINFGVEPFRYEGPEVMISSAIADHRAAAALLHRASTTISATSAAISSLMAVIAEAAVVISSDGLGVGTVTIFNDTEAAAEAQGIDSSGEAKRLLRILDSADGFFWEYSTIRLHALSLLKFILVETCIASTMQGSTDPRDLPSGPAMAKGISLFGTPSCFTCADGVELELALVNTILDEVVMGTTYLLGGIADYGSGLPAVTICRPPRFSKTLRAISSSPSIEDGSSVVEAMEVDTIVYEYLTLCSSLLDHSQALRRDLASPKTLSALLSLLHAGSARTRRLVGVILACVLPLTAPDDAEAAVGADWRAILSAASREALDTGAQKKRRQRRMPDTILKVLMYGIRGAVSVVSSYLAVEESSGLYDSPANDVPSLQHARKGSIRPSGYGAMTLASADQHTALIQRLFETASWTELVACHLTDNLREASEQLEVLLTASGAYSTPQAVELMTAASITCSVLCGFSTLRVGAKIRTSTDAIGWIVALSDRDSTASVVFSQSLPQDNDFLNLETVALSSVTPVLDSIRIDLTRLSQPLVLQLMSLAKQLLAWFHLQRSSQAAVSPALGRCLYRLSSICATALSTLIDGQGDFISECTGDAALIGLIVSIASLPSGLPYLPTLQCVTRTWGHVQYRALEVGLGEETKSVVDSSSTPTLDLAASRDHEAFPEEPNEEKDDDTPTGAVPASLEPLRFTPLEEKRRLARLLSAHTGLPLQSCIERLEFFNGNNTLALESLTEEAAAAPSSVDSDEALATIVDKADMADSHILRNIDHVGLEQDPEITFSSSSSELALQRILLQETVGSEGSQELCLVAADSLPLGGLVLQSKREGPESLTGGGRAASLMQSCSNPAFGDSSNPSSSSMSTLIVASFDHVVGIPMSEIVETNSFRLVTSFFGANDSSRDEVLSLAQELDEAVTVLRMRDIASKMLIGGEASLFPGSSADSNTESWLRLMKLSLTLTPTPSGKEHKAGLATMCAALFGQMKAAPEAVEGSGAERVGDALVKSALSDLKALYNAAMPISSCASSRTSGGEENEIMTFSSPHPFSAPAFTEGEIDIPEHWRGALFTFHPLCATPSPAGKLEFFKGGLAQPALHIFFGQGEAEPRARGEGSDDDCSSSPFHSFFISRSEAMSWAYRFTAPLGGDRPPLACTPLSPMLRVDAKKCSIERVTSKAAVGMGDEDTLFNLFDSSAGQSGADSAVGSSRAIAAAVDCAAVDSGTWYFETTIQLGDPPSGRTDEIANNRIGLVSSSAAARATGLGEFDGSFSVSGDGVVRSFFGATGADLQRYICAEDRWISGDVIGFLFDVLPNEEGSDVYIFRNGLAQTYADQARIHIPSSGQGLRPAFELTANAKYIYNFGERPFEFSSQIQDFEQCRDLKSSWKPLVARPIAGPADGSWGYRFSVQPLTVLYVKVCRDFELIACLRPDDVSKPPPAVAAAAPEEVWVWRARCSKDYWRPCGDLVTTSPCPPCGALVVDRSQCKPPMSFKKVFASSKLGVTVWRPVPRDGFVALGDVLVNTCSSTQPALDLCMCVPLWAAVKCPIGRRLLGCKKGGDSKAFSISIWSIQNDLGTFFASPSEHQSLPLADKAAGRGDVVGVGEGYRLLQPVRNLISGEWATEVDVLTQPSLSWSCGVLSFLLSSPATRRMVLLPRLFSTLVRYVRSSASPAPLMVVPLIISMIRYAQQDSIDLPLEQIGGLCKSILQKALQKAQADKSCQLSDALVTLVDLVVEVQSSQVASTARATPSRPADNIVVMSASSQRDSPITLVCPDDLIMDIDRNGYPAAIATNDNWWERSSLLRDVVRREMLIKPDKVGTMFARESVTRKLKQVLNFFAALGSERFTPSSAPSSSSSSDAGVFPYPRLMIAKIWNDYVSSCLVEESAHPHSNLSETKTICVPGADRYTVTFDSRCHVAPNCTLIIKYNSVPTGASSAPATTQHALRGSFGEDGRVAASGGVLHVPSSEFYLSFEVAPNPTPTPDDKGAQQEQYWGWAFVVAAEGPLFEGSEAQFELSEQSLAADAAGAINRHSPSHAPIDAEEVANPNPNPSASARSRSSSASSSASYTMPAPTNRPSIDPAAGVPRSCSEKDEKRARAVCSAGTRVVSEGAIVIPYASATEVIFERPYPKHHIYKGHAAAPIVVAVMISYHDASGKQREAPLLLPADEKSVKFTAPASRMKYSVYALTLALTDALMLEAEAEAATAAEVSAEVSAAPSAPLTLTPAPGRGIAGLEDDSEPLLPWIDDSDAGADADQPWSCVLCTMINSIHQSECSVCLNARPGTEPAADGEAAGVGWWCSSCTFINALSVTACTMCGASNGVQTGDAPSPSPSQGNAAGEAPTSPLSDVADTDAALATHPAFSDSDRHRTRSAAASGDKDIIIVTATGSFTAADRFKTRLEGAMLNPHMETPYSMSTHMLAWSRAADEALLEHINGDHASINLSRPSTIRLPRGVLTYQADSLQHCSLLSIQMRIMLLDSLNNCLEELLPIVNLKNTDPQSIGSMIRKYSRYIFMRVKVPLLDKAVLASATASGPGLPAALTLDNFKALSSRESMEKEPVGSQCCFVQAFRQLQKKDSSVFRYTFSGDRVFQINFSGESGIDAGGVFREGASRVVEDLFSEHFNLLLLCPNGQHGVYTNMDKFIPHPQHTSPLALQMFEFVGRLMGMSLRAKLCLPFEFPSLIWKSLVGEEITFGDLLAVDGITCRLLEAVRHCERDGIVDQGSFGLKYGDKLRFVYTGSDGVERELRPDGAGRSVTYTNRHEFCDAVLSARLGEFVRQTQAIRKGLWDVVPTRALQLFSWQQLDALVCGDPVFDLAVWKAKTDSTGLPSKTLNLFWKVMESFSHKDQAGFVRFAWGRSRLPAEKDFTTKMKLTSAGRAKLPAAHTCFFSVELPEYETEEEMRHGLLTCIHFGVGGILMG